MEPSHYDYVPEIVQRKLTTAHAAHQAHQANKEDE
jgi:hypothetical protein